MWESDSDSVSSAAVSSDSRQQLYMAVSSSSRSPQLSRVPSELDTSVPADTQVRRSRSSTTTLTPDRSDQEDDADVLQTFYDNTETVRGSPHSSEEALDEERNKINLQVIFERITVLRSRSSLLCNLERWIFPPLVFYLSSATQHLAQGSYPNSN